MSKATQLQVRRARHADAAGIALAHDRSWRTGYHGLVHDGSLDAMSVGERERTWREVLAGDRGSLTTWVAVGTAGDVLGFIAFGAAPPFGDEAEHIGAPPPRPDVGSIVALYVRPEVWRRGIGRRLVAIAKDQVARAGCKSVSLWVLAENDRARAFYAALGFWTDGVTALHAPTNAEELRMSSKLSP
jgi:ribosomal protein S18 acetylase RimI-like enzyme